MATVEHTPLTTGELHEPKGIATANANTVYIADGAGSGDWRLKPVGYCEYSSPTGTTITTPTTFTLVNPATTAGFSLAEFSHNGSGRLTYTGSATIGMKLTVSLGAQQTSAGTADISLAVNGLPLGPYTSASVTGGAGVVGLHLVSFVEFSTNDYVEVYAQCSAGNLVVENLVLMAEGII